MADSDAQRPDHERPDHERPDHERPEQPWTVMRLLEWTTQFFRERGSDSPRLDAEILLAHARKCERIALYTAFGECPDESQRTVFRDLVRRRGGGAPVAYLVGYREFYSLRLRVDENVLIPRPETEHVVIEALDALKSRPIEGRPAWVADVGTGSGAIAIAVAKHLRGGEVVATDVSDEALRVAERNRDDHGLSDRIRLVRGDLLDGVDAGKRFDVICSNPPYVSESEYAELEREIREHEPRGALVAGPTGTEVIERLLAIAPGRLEPGGTLIVELSPMIAARCLELAGAQAGLVESRLVKDLDGQQRLLVARRAAVTG